jgi:hypothetical protein
MKYDSDDRELFAVLVGMILMSSLITGIAVLLIIVLVRS